MGRKKSLNHLQDLEEIKARILRVSEDSQPRWGKMNAAQMFRHCDKILQVGFGKIVLPRTNFLIKKIGILTKNEMKIFNNGIPPNMPTFPEVIADENCNFEKSRDELLAAIDEFAEKSVKNNLLSEHALFGRMTTKDWGFMEYKHLNHHLKQFKV